MNIKTIILLSMAAISTPLVAMPTKQDIDKVAAVVQDLMRPEQEAMNDGRKTRTEVAQAATSLAEQADSEAAKLLLLKGAFNLYVRDGAFDEAVGTLKTLKETIPDMPPQIVANLIESSLRSVSKKNGGQLYRLLDETKTYIRYQNELKTDLARSAKEPANRMLHLKIAEKYAVLGNWTKALEEFTKGNDRKAADIAQAERGEKTDLTKKSIADFWWDYPVRKGEEIQKAFKQHAAALYEAAIASGDISGLVKVQAERRIEEIKEAGKLNIGAEIELANGFNSKTIEIDLGGKEKLDFIRCPAGKYTIGSQPCDYINHPQEVKITRPFFVTKYPVTYAAWDRMVGGVKLSQRQEALGGMKCAVHVEVRMAKEFCARLNKKFGKKLPKGYVFRLPSMVEWEYACTAGGKGKQEAYKYAHTTDEKLITQVGVSCKEKGMILKSKGLISDEENFRDNEETGMVGTKKANDWGLYDMLGGTVFHEWLLDTVSYLTLEKFQTNKPKKEMMFATVKRECFDWSKKYEDPLFLDVGNDCVGVQVDKGNMRVNGSG